MTQIFRTSLLTIALSIASSVAFADNEAGKKTYDQACAACHASGVAGAPKLGGKDAWAARIATGNDALYASAINGKGAMPAKGGQVAIPDEEIKATVDYMVSSSVQ